MQNTIVALGLSALIPLAFAGAAGAEGGANKGAQTKQTSGKASSTQSAQLGDETMTYAQAVDARIDLYERRIGALEKATTKAPKEQRAELQGAVKDLRAELKQTKQLGKQIKNAKGDQWISIHDDLEDSFDDMDRIYATTVMDMPADFVAIVLVPVVGEQPVERARAAETARPGAGGKAEFDVQRIDVASLVKSDTPYAKHVSERLQAFQDRVVALERAAQQASSPAREEIREEISDLTQQIKLTAELASELGQAENPEQWAMLHDRIENRLDSLSVDYLNATAVLGPAAFEKAMMQGAGGRSGQQGQGGGQKR